MLTEKKYSVFSRGKPISILVNLDLNEIGNILSVLLDSGLDKSDTSLIQDLFDIVYKFLDNSDLFDDWVKYFNLEDLL